MEKRTPVNIGFLAPVAKKVFKARYPLGHGCLFLTVHMGREYGQKGQILCSFLGVL